jgi:eukaryotic-like serine/threonine-protein kinase
MSKPLTAFDQPSGWPAGTGAGVRPLPTHIGKYKVISRLGEGATSDVFLARDEFKQRNVAIKRVRETALLDENETHYQTHFFAAEASLVGRLQHPNVVKIFDAVEDPQGPYLVMEHVPGVTLRRFCRPDALLPLDQIVEIGFKCAMALGYVFRLGLIHRDVKPANMLAVLRNGQIVDLKLSDFGSVLHLQSERTQVFRVGSLAYMSPEQLNGDTLDARSDMYSLAAVLFHLISGRAPFEAAQQPVLMHQIFHQAPADLASLREGVSPKLAALIGTALSKKREDRQLDWDEFARELAALVTRGDVPRGPLQGVVDSERFSLLRQLEFFARFGDVELWEVVHRAKWQRFKFGDALFRKGDSGNTFHIVAHGQVEVVREGKLVATLGPGQSVGEMAYLAPNDELRTHQVDVVVPQSTTTISFTPNTLGQLGPGTQLLFDKAFIAVLVRRLHAAHESLAHPRRIL